MRQKSLSWFFLLRKQHSEVLNKIKKWFNEELSNKCELKNLQNIPSLLNIFELHPINNLAYFYTPFKYGRIENKNKNIISILHKINQIVFKCFNFSEKKSWSECK